MQEWGFLGVTFVLEKNLTLKVCKPMKGMKITDVIKSSESYETLFAH